MTNIETLAKKIFDECLKEGEPVTKEESIEMAKMEIGAKGIKNYAKAENSKPKAPKTPKIDTEKVEIVEKIAEFVQNAYGNVKITNKSKILEFDFGENHYKIDLIKQRKPKN